MNGPTTGRPRPGRLTASVLTSAVFAAGVLVTGLPAAVASADKAPAQVHWTPCKDRPAVSCGTLQVPVDWSHPHGPSITVAVARRPADDPHHRIGTLFYNPGGPGDGATDYVINAEKIFSATLRARFDLVGMDPRAVGRSTRVTCAIPVLTPTGTLFPRSEQAFDELRRHNREVGRDCLKRTGALMEHADTVSVARDHEALRRALGVQQVSWFGVSYGTQVAANYADLYPRHTRAMAMDAAIDHSLSESQQVRDEARTAEDSFNRFIAWCRTASACALRGADVGTVFDRLVREADRHPIPVPGAMHAVTGEDIRMGTKGLLRFKEPSIYGPDLSWGGLSRALRRTLDGDASAFALPAKGPQDGMFGLLAIACGDYAPQIHSYSDLRRRMDKAERWAPHLQGASETWQALYCIDWPVPAANPPHRLDVRGVPTLLVHARHDPSDAYSWSQRLGSQIEGSVLLTRTGDGHTSYYTSACARNAIDAYLVHPKTPDRLTCVG